MNARGEYGNSWKSARYSSVGVGAVYHSVGDRAEAVRQLALDWTALYQNLAVQAGELTPDPTAPNGYHYTTQRELDASPPDPKKVEWWKAYAKPIFNEWVKFKNEQLGVRSFASDYIAFAERWQTNWDVYERWMNKLNALRGEAKARGFRVTAPPPTPLPTTIIEEAGKKAKDAVEGAGDVWTFVKYAAWAALGIGTVIALSSVAQNLKAGKDPAERYMQFIRSRPRAAARAVVPAPVRLALPAPATV